MERVLIFSCSQCSNRDSHVDEYELQLDPVLSAPSWGITEERKQRDDGAESEQKFAICAEKITQWKMDVVLLTTFPTQNRGLTMLTCNNSSPEAYRIIVWLVGGKISISSGHLPQCLMQTDVCKHWLVTQVLKSDVLRDTPRVLRRGCYMQVWHIRIVA